MKYLIPILTLSLCSACATRKPAISESVASVSGKEFTHERTPRVRTSESVKAYPVGRYTDPNFPEQMHERHTVYRREKSPDWNYLPDPPYALRLGPTVATSNPSPSYYVNAEGESNARQRAYAEALQEQNGAMKKRIEALQKDFDKIPILEKEVERLKGQLETAPILQKPTTPGEAEPPDTLDGDSLFSRMKLSVPEVEEFTDPSEIVLFANSDDENQAFLISQMRINDEIAAELDAVRRRKRDALFIAPFLRRRELALFSKYNP